MVRTMHTRAHITGADTISAATAGARPCAYALPLSGLLLIRP